MSSNNGHLVSTMDKTLDVPPESEAGVIIDQLPYLIRVLDQSDVSELEVRLTATNARIMLRKARGGAVEAETLVESPIPSAEETGIPPTSNRHILRAACVGFFHRWSKPKEPLHMAVGDKVREGQHIGLIQSLGIFHEVESHVAGSVAEILVEDGQPVEFGQPLLAVDVH